ncbi:MAG: hypothetical protein ACTHJ4_06965 [Candidatus Nucleicultricaceae bacterium]
MSFSIINDAVHGIMEFDKDLAEKLKKIIDQPAFQSYVTLSN